VLNLIWQGLIGLIVGAAPPSGFGVSFVMPASSRALQATMQEKENGSIEEGKYADMIVLDRNLFQIPAENISDTKVLVTIFEGKTVYRAPAPTQRAAGSQRKIHA
jgi:cytosine/adenosine deaminase-related metal-dependent hydrolase